MPKIWNDVASVPRDGTLVLLLVAVLDEDDPMHDAMTTEDDTVWRTIGFNTSEINDGPEWHMAGWCWTQDIWTQNWAGTVIGWLPLPDKEVLDQ